MSAIHLVCCKMQDERNTEDDSDEEEMPEITQWEAIAWLAVLTTWVSILSGYLVDAIQVLILFPYVFLTMHVEFPFSLVL